MRKYKKINISCRHIQELYCLEQQNCNCNSKYTPTHYERETESKRLLKRRQSATRRWVMRSNQNLPFTNKMNNQLSGLEYQIY